jgi:hypothetical protein
MRVPLYFIDANVPLLNARAATTVADSRRDANPASLRKNPASLGNWSHRRAVAGKSVANKAAKK